MDKCYIVFALLRIILTCVPQSGYIHPDEYFQSIEVIAEKVLDVQATKPWEFNASFPVRSVGSMYLTVGLSFQILKTVNYFVGLLLGFTLITPYFVVVFPRMLMCLLSFIVDWSLYKICLVNYEKYQSRCVVLSISYIMLIYGTHTFSNSIELILFALLLYSVCESLIFSTTNIKKHQYLNLRYNSAVGPVEKAKFRKLQLFLESDSLRNWFIISTITVVGIFNRPTFIVFAVGPVFFWLYRGIGFRSISTLSFYLRACMFQIGMIPTLLLYIVMDSFYFGYLTWGEIGVFKVALDNFVVTPWNFIKYNTKSKNLAQHGLHPHYLHAAVNIPLLFNVLALFCYLHMMELIKYIGQTKYHYLPSVRSIKGLMITSIILPLILLSCIPHQEPRFLIPLILPLVYLYGGKILPESDTVVVKASKVNKHSSRKTDIRTSVLYKAWIIINIALSIFYGFLHQGGIYSFISHMNTEMKNTQYEYHIITSHVYSIPESLFLQKTAKYDSYHKSYKSAKRIIIHEQGSKNVTKLLPFIQVVLKYCQHKSTPNCKVQLLMPNTLMDEFQYRQYERHKDLVVKNVNYFYPHVSIERLPDVLPCLNITECLSSATTAFSKYFKLFSLNEINQQLKKSWSSEEKYTV